MNAQMATLHAVFAALWIGCVLTEALFERALLAGNREQHRLLAELHMKVDWLIELPAIVLTVATGAFLWCRLASIQWTHWLMLGAGLIAVGFNLLCIQIVYKRRQAARVENWQRFGHLDRLQHRFGAAVLFGQLVALGVALLR